VTRTYRFTDDWYVAAEPQAVRDRLRHVAGWPDWWPSCVAVEPSPPQRPATDEAWRFTFQTRLPYRMAFQADVVREEPMAVDTVVAGRVRGEGRWRVEPFADGVRVHFDWLVEPRVPWMRLVSPVARPLFVWNHQALMLEGARSFARVLGVPMPRPPTCTPPLTSAALQVGLGLALVVGLVLLARASTGRRPAGG